MGGAGGNEDRPIAATTIERAALCRFAVFGARVLGASQVQAFLRVTAPLLAPAVLGGAILAFAISMDNFVVSLFLTGGSSTLPLLIWSRMREFFDPTVNAMATLYIVMTLLAAVIAERVSGLRATRAAS